MKTVEERLSDLERTNRRYRSALVGIGSIALLGATMAAHQEPQVPEVVQAKRFEVVDESGNTRIAMFTDDSGSGRVYVNNSDGVTVATLAVVRASGRLRLRNGAGGPAATLRGGDLRLYNAAEETIVLIGSSRNRSGVLQLNDASGNPRLLASIAGTSASSGGALRAINSTGKVVLYAGASSSQQGILQVMNSRGTKTGELGAGETGARFTLSNASGKQVFYAGAEANTRNGLVILFDRSGNRVREIP